MGIDFTILKNKHNIKIIDIYKASQIFKKAVIKANYFYMCEKYITSDYKEKKKIRKYYIYVSEDLKFNPNNRCFIMKFTTENYIVKDTICKNENFIYLGYTDAVRNCEDMFLKVIYEYLKICPSEFIETDYNCLFSKSDIEKIINLPYNKNWYYNN